MGPSVLALLMRYPVIIHDLFCRDSEMLEELQFQLESQSVRSHSAPGFKVKHESQLTVYDILTDFYQV